MQYWQKHWLLRQDVAVVDLSMRKLKTPSGGMTRKDYTRLRLCLRLHHRVMHYQSYNHLINRLDKCTIARIIKGTSAVTIDLNIELHYANASTQLPAVA
ncbi:MAG: hypothetical protein EZS28_020885 [Streblomastix strix]|uniref:Uncharacterized protein n=1 Tax=Streblomastix strix TaxID=222440 RepID=A0A5J4VLR7_9EUKA|nr:MAG: hypothetical protein EZS28_020885 [Streblomastix strix]